MSQRSRPPASQRLHPHCESCYSRRCRAPPERTVSCAMAPCPLLCGAVFHLCKQQEHSLLCPNQRLPCLNAAYGCPHAMTRAALAAHLRRCPASVVCCSMEWLRWPVDDTHPHHLGRLQEEVQREDRERAEEEEEEEEVGRRRGRPLDLAMALADQSVLFGRLKMKPLYPELMEAEEEEKKEVQAEVKGGNEDRGSEPVPVENGNAARTNQAAVGGISNGVSQGEEKAFEGAGAGQRSCTGVNKEGYNLCDMMFSMEKGGCAVAEGNRGAPKLDAVAGDGSEEAGARRVAGGPSQDTGQTGHAPWQDGVMERLGQELSPQEYNMYLVHHGRMLLTFGKIQACTPRDKDFVYGSLEPIPLRSLHSFKVPVSFHYKQRVQQAYDASMRVQSEERGVDTSDLDIREEDWHEDEADATLLGYAELEVMGHKICEMKGTDGHYVDVGMQTHSFRTTPFTRDTTLGEVAAAGGASRLRLQLQAATVSSRHNRASSVFTFSCGHSFHRSEYPAHFRNVHNDIQAGVGDWFEQRCPLAYLGCTYSQRRFQPSTHNATVSYDRELSCFNLRPEDRPPAGPPESRSPSQGARRRAGPDSLSLLPYEVLCHVAGFLDSLSLSQLALVSRLLRDVCASLLRDRGMVTLRWQKKTYSHGGTKWRARPVWEFSHLFSRVDTWRFADVPPVSAHLKVCPYYKSSLSRKPVALVGMKDTQGGPSERQTLVNQFTGNRLPLI